MKPELITGPAAEPLSLTDAKKQLEIGSGTDHDDQINALIEAARQQWEHDTQAYLIEQTWRLRLPGFYEFQFSHRPVTAVSSVTYFDTGNTSQTLSSSIYQLDTANNRFRLAHDQDWPDTEGRWDAVTVNYTLGEHAAATTVPEIAKQAMKLLIGHYFENRDMLMTDAMMSLRAYESLVRRYMRSTYP